MHRNLLTLLLCLIVCSFTFAPNANAQDYLDVVSVSIDGEPTDLEGIINLIGSDTLDDNDISTTAPTGDTSVESWLEQLLDLLVQLGLLPGGNN